MNIKTEDLHMLEWSRNNKRFNIAPLVTGLSQNQMALMTQAPSDYLVIWIGPKEACEAMASNWASRLNAPALAPDVEGVPV